ncbi:MAG: hypothetical protein OXC80_09965 [Gammaproteobacteria bacterium]|nr:hypothetical protein [Gammaproteobacteria bacterium]
MSESVSYADIAFQDGRLYSPRFSDIYFAKDGPAETDRVFLDPARIFERISRCSEFTIVEFGFGSGLNFFQTVQRFIDSKSKARLRYISFERYPLTNIARRHALKQWSRNWNVFEEFCQTSSPPVGGWHRRFFHDSVV